MLPDQPPQGIERTVRLLDESDLHEVEQTIALLRQAPTVQNVRLAAVLHRLTLDIRLGWRVRADLQGRLEEMHRRMEKATEYIDSLKEQIMTLEASVELLAQQNLSTVTPEAAQPE